MREKLGQAMAGMRTAADAEVARQHRHLAKLGEEREKLLRAYYAGAVPLELLRSEQERLSTETAQAERQIEVADASSGDAEDTLAKALDLLADCERAYARRRGTCAASGTRRSLSGWLSMTTGSPTPRSPSRSQRWPAQTRRLGWVVRQSPEPALLLAAVQMRSF